MTLLNPDQARRLDTHLSLLAADLDALAAAPELTFASATGVHPNLASHLDARVNALRLSLERLADAAGALP